jgi:hypothetical protein
MVQKGNWERAEEKAGEVREKEVAVADERFGVGIWGTGTAWDGSPGRALASRLPSKLKHDNR